MFITTQINTPQAAHLLRSWVRIPPGTWIFVCCECRVLSGRGLCDELITLPEESYGLCCVVVCDLETSRIGAPYIYDIRSLRVKVLKIRIFNLDISFVWQHLSPSVILVNISLLHVNYTRKYEAHKILSTQTNTIWWIKLVYVKNVILSSPKRPARICGSPSFLFNDYRLFFPRR